MEKIKKELTKLNIQFKEDKNQLYFKDKELYFKILLLKDNSEFGDIKAKKNTKLLVNSLENRLVVFEDELEPKRELILSMLKHRLGIFGKKIRATTLEFIEIDNPIKFKQFFISNHIDGYVASSFMYGLFDKDKLISAMTFRKSGIDKCWEIARFCTDIDYHVYGSASKLLKNWNLGKLVTFSNNRLSNGRTYELLNFKEITKTFEPSYYYTDFSTRLWRYKCKRINDVEIKNKFPTEKDQAIGGVFSEKFLGHSLPLYKIYDLGHKKWELTSMKLTNIIQTEREDIASPQ